MPSRILLSLWLVSDLLLFVASYALAYFLRVGFLFSTDFPFDHYLQAVAFVAPLWMLVLATTRTFHLTRNQKTLRNGAYIAYASLVGMSLVTLAYYFRFTDFFSRLLLIEAFLICTVATWVWHIVFNEIARRILRRDPPVFPTLVVGRSEERRVGKEGRSRWSP